jgi:hypothetical protein
MQNTSTIFTTDRRSYSVQCHLLPRCLSWPYDARINAPKRYNLRSPTTVLPMLCAASVGSNVAEVIASVDADLDMAHGLFDFAATKALFAPRLHRADRYVF